MKLTAIKKQVKRADRYSLFFDDKYAFSLSESEVLALGLRIGQEFSENELKGLHQKAVLDKAYDSCLNLLSRRPRSEWELTTYLTKKDYDKNTVSLILNVLSKKGYVNDRDFASRWVANRRLLKSVSKRRLIQELKLKRIDNTIIEQVLVEDLSDEKQVIKKLIENKRRQIKYQDDIRLAQYLCRQGFNYADVRTVLDEEKIKEI